MGLTLHLLPDRLAVARLDPADIVPEAVLQAPFCSITRTPEELSVVAPEWLVPTAWRREDGWRALRVAGPLDFALTGVLASLAGPLAEAEIPIFTISTFDTDYVLVREARLPDAARVLRGAGHSVVDD